MRRASVLVTMLLDGEIEFLACARSQMPPSANVSFRSFGFHGAVLLVRPGHPLLGDASLDVADFPIITAGPVGGHRDELYKGQVEFYRYKRRMTVERTEALAHLVETSDAIWMSSTFAAVHELAQGSLVPLIQDVGGRLNILFHDQPQPSIDTKTGKITPEKVERFARTMRAKLRDAEDAQVRTEPWNSPSQATHPPKKSSYFYE